LIYGFGNPGRQDDGLGIFLAEKLENWKNQNQLDNISVEVNYQLNIEDSADISEKDIVIFVDATEENINDFCFEEIRPSSVQEYSMHSISPNFVLFLSENIFNKKPQAFILKMQGYKWNLKEGLSKKAERNLQRATEFMKEYLIHFKISKNTV